MPSETIPSPPYTSVLTTVLSRLPAYTLPISSELCRALFRRRAFYRENHPFLDPVRTEFEFQMCLRTLSKEEVLAVWRLFDRKAAGSKTLAIQRVLGVVRNKKTIFDALPVLLGPKVERVLGEGGGVFVMKREVFRLCRLGFEIHNAFREWVDDQVQDGFTVEEFLDDVKLRGARRLPQAWSPGFKFAMGEEEGDDSEAAVEQQAPAGDATVDPLDSDLPTCTLDPLFASFPTTHQTAYLAYKAGMDVSAFAARASYNDDRDPSKLKRLTVDCEFTTLLHQTESNSILTTLQYFFLEADYASLGKFAVQCARQIEPPLLTHENLQFIRSAPHLDARILFCDAVMFCVDYLEKQKSYDEAAELLKLILDMKLNEAHRGKAQWYNRLSIDLDHLKKKNESLDVCRKALADAELEPNEPGLFPLRARLTSSPSAAMVEHLVEIVHGKPFGRSFSNKGKIKYIHPDEDTVHVTLDVEDFVMIHYKSQHGWMHGWHCENFPFYALFRLLMNDIFALPVDGLMACGGNNGRPPDLRSRHGQFYVNRQSQIDALLNDMRTWTRSRAARCVGEAYQTSALKRYVERTNLEIKVQAWGLQVIAACLNGPGLAKVCEMLCKQQKSLGAGGAPDCVLIRGIPDSFIKIGQRCLTENELTMLDSLNDLNIKFVEVKSETDHLSDTQIAWLLNLHRAGFEAKVCKVVCVKVGASSVKKPRVKKNKPARRDLIVKKVSHTQRDEEDDGEVFESLN